MVKNYGSVTAVDHLSLRVDHGQVVALLGPNGAGKTTTIEICEGFTQPSSGTVEVLGANPVTDPQTVRNNIGIMLQGGGAYPGIRVGEMLDLAASYCAHPLDTAWLLDTVGLAGLKKSSYRRLSGGQKQRLSLALCLVGRPQLVFLDEPTAGMDTQSRLAVWDLIDSLRRDGVTTVLTTHLMDEAEALADKVVIIDSGRTVAEGTPAELTSGQAEATVARIRLDTATPLDPGRATAFLRGGDDTASNQPQPTVTAVKPLTYRISGTPTPELVEKVAAAAREQNVLVRHLAVDHRSLEDVFLDITGTSLRS
ncbi:ABC transporter ATP-binding protein [Corynebacterium sp. CCM 8862]|uniref:ABC transporter ATP-binding protein n=1 Tax=Corynebacterium mendelii TaxID=2765362 RepID=A0A939E0T2_9CORY|nr:ABC transporter ATP-binding protein [Corynebacterium mendelii]MBN9643452.1 ABC transporter ATP-binding protein [Corynebacterium mendelii]